MKRRFQRHYTLEEARALLPMIQQRLTALRGLRDSINRFHRRLERDFPNGYDLGGPTVHQYVRNWFTLHELLEDLEKRSIIVRDLDRGLVDFPALRDGREVFLCWEEGEPDIAYWHDLDAGYAGRQPL
jgi:hypothetical protein